MAYQRIHQERLLALAEFLDSVPDKKFNYETWLLGYWKGETEIPCGSQACALGWATQMPLFKELGLYLAKASSTFPVPVIALHTKEGDLVPGNQHGENSVLLQIYKRIFGTSDVRDLFYPTAVREECFTAPQVARKIRNWTTVIGAKLLKGKETPAPLPAEYDGYDHDDDGDDPCDCDECVGAGLDADGEDDGDDGDQG